MWMEDLGYRGYKIERNKESLTGHPISSVSAKLPSCEVNVVFSKEEPKFQVNNRLVP